MFVALFILRMLLSPAALATTLTIPGDANIFGAGHASAPAPGGGGAGELPVEFDLGFSAGTGVVLTFSSVTGSVTLNNGSGNNANDPDGIGSASDIGVNSFDGISGVVGPNAGFLAGVFLGPSEPADPAPLRLDFTVISTSFTSLSPQLNQVFFIGDGLTGNGNGTVQQFNVPVGATRLFLGLADAPNYHGDPGAYGDNIGSFSATFFVPEPSPLALFGTGTCLAGLCFWQARRIRELPTSAE
jgi:PEP-CTERM motif-containing protein